MLTERGEWISEQLALHKLLPSVSYGREIREILKKLLWQQVISQCFKKGWEILSFNRFIIFK